MSPFPEGARVLEVFLTARGVAYVSLSPEAAGIEGGTTPELLAVYSLVNTIVTNFASIKRVQILVGDRMVDTLAGHVDLSRPLGPDFSLLALPSAPPEPLPSPSCADAPVCDERRAAGPPWLQLQEVPDGGARGRRSGGHADCSQAVRGWGLLLVSPSAAAQAPTRRPATGPKALRASLTRRRRTDGERRLAEASTDAEGALSAGLAALAATVDFEPTAFVKAGRKGEVVEDDYLSRPGTPIAGTGLASTPPWAESTPPRGDHEAAVRYLRRAEFLGPDSSSGRAARGCLSPRSVGPQRRRSCCRDSSPRVGPGQTSWRSSRRSSTRQAGRASRSRSIGPESWPSLGGARSGGTGHFELPKGTRLSTAPVFRMADAAVNVIYAAEASCQTCSEDVEALRRGDPALPRGSSSCPRDRTTTTPCGRCSVCSSVSWPVMIGPGLGSTLGVTPRSVLIVGRGGWGAALLPGAPEAGARQGGGTVGKDGCRSKSLPRPGWNRRPVERSSAHVRYRGCGPRGWRPATTSLRQPEFEAAVTAYREKRPAEAMRLFDESPDAGTDGSFPPRPGSTARCVSMRSVGERRRESSC